jgi:tetratricopeptide (TPR) repeat protein
MNPGEQPERSFDSGVDADNPWPGLVAYTEELQEFFYGREDEADELLRRAGGKNLTVLFGQSGLGKSSLLQAGLFPRLRREGYLPVAIRLDHSPSAPRLSMQVITAVTRAILEAGGRLEETDAEQAGTLWEHFHRRALVLRTSAGRPIRPVLVFDQFEELFAIGHAREDSRARALLFLTELADFVENRAPEALEQQLNERPEMVKQFAFDDRDLRSLISLREDYLPHLESLRRSMPSITENRMRLTRMDGGRALEAVAKPGGRLITSEIAELVVRFVAGGRRDDDELDHLEVEPSLLALVCRELNNRRLATGLSQITSDLVAGNRERILQDFYEHCVADQPPAVRAFVEDELVTDSGLRENMALERAHKSIANRGASPAAIDDLVKRRLLHLEDRLDIQRVELTHDVLTSVVKKSRDDRQQREAALEVENKARADRAKARVQRRRFRAVIAGMAVALAIVTAFGVWSYRLYQLSNERLLESQRQRLEAERQRDRASRSEADASQARREAEVVKEVFDGVSVPVTEQKVRHLAGLSPVHEELVNIRSKSLELLSQKTPDDPAIEPKMALAQALLGTISSSVGSFRAAEGHLTKALERYNRLGAAHPENRDYRLGACRALLELGFLYWDDNRRPAARHWYEKALARLESEHVQAPDDPEVAYELGLCLNRLSGCLPATVTKDQRESMASRAVGLFDSLVKRNYRAADSLGALGVARYRLVWTKFDGKDQHALLKSLDEIAALYAKALKLEPTSPYLNSIGVFLEWDRSNAHVKLGEHKEALAASEASVEKAREIVKQSPDLSKYGDLLAESLKLSASNFRRVGKEDDARAALDESIQIVDGLVRRRPDWGFYASQWLDFQNELADFFESGPKTHGEIQARQDRLRTLDQTLKRGRELAARFPDHHNVQVNLASTLANRGRFDTSVNRDAAAFPFLLEAVDIYRNRILADSEQATESDVNTYLKSLHSAVNCASYLSNRDEIIRLSQLAAEVRTLTTYHEAIDSLGSIMYMAAQAHRDAGRLREAIEAYQKAIDVRRPAYAAAPWHWYLHSHLGETYAALAETYHLAKDHRNEVLAQREYLKLIIAQWWNTKVDDYVDPARPTDEAEADRNRALIKRALGSGSVALSISSDFAGLRRPVTIYITNVTPPKHPLEDQAKWLAEVRGGTIARALMDRIARMNDEAKQSNKSLVEVCNTVYPKVQDVAKLEIENLGILSSEKGSPNSADALATTQARVLEMKSKLDRSPRDFYTIHEAAQTYQDYGVRRLRDRQTHEAIVTLSSALKLREQLVRDRPTLVYYRQLLVETATWLAKGQAQAKDYVGASNSLLKRLDVLQQLEREQPAESRQPAIAETHLLFGELAELRGDRTEALGWYGRAAETESERAALKIANFLQATPDLNELLPASLKGVYDRSVQSGIQANHPAFVSNYLAGARNTWKYARLSRSAAQWHRLALTHEALKHTDEYRNALAQEFDARQQQRELDDTHTDVKSAQIEAAVRMARSYMDSKQMSLASTWTDRAASLGHIESLLSVADWSEKGELVKRDPAKAARYRYLGYYNRGLRSFNAGRYADALADFKNVCASASPDALDFDMLGRCHGKLGQWDDAAAAYRRCVELDRKNERAPRVVISLLESLTCADRPEQLLHFVEAIEKNGWKLPSSEDATTIMNGALYFGYQAIALRVRGKDPATAERKMRELTDKPEFARASWNYFEVDKWLTASKLAPEAKTYAERIINDLKGTPESVLQLADRYETGNGVKADPQQASHYRYLGHFRRANKLFRDLRFKEALADLKRVCESVEATAYDHGALAKCYAKLGQFDDGIMAATRSIELYGASDNATAVVLDLLDALTCAERFSQLLEFIQAVQNKGWKLNPAAYLFDKYNAGFNGLRAIALQSTGNDAAEAQRLMRQSTNKPEYGTSTANASFSSADLDEWLKKTKLSPVAKSRALEIVSEMKGTPESLLALADKYENGTGMKAEPAKATHYRYLAHHRRATRLIRDHQYATALPELKKVSEAPEATAIDFDRLGTCQSSLGQRDEAIASYIRSLDLDSNGDRATRAVLNVLEGLTCAERFSQMLEFITKLEKKGWKPPVTGLNADKNNAIFHGYCAIALNLTGADAAEAERLMRQHTGKPEFAATNWTSTELDNWLKTTKLESERKARVERIVNELKGTPESFLQLAGRYDNGTGVPLDLQKANHFRYLAYYKRGLQSFRGKRFQDALPDLKKVCEFAEATALDFDNLAMCYGKVGLWDDAIASYTRSIELDLKSDRATGVVLNLLEALTCTERFSQILEFILTIENKGWRLPTTGSNVERYGALFHGFRAIALHMTGGDASDAERAMRQFTSKPAFQVRNWTWDELNNWLKTTKLAPDRKAVAEKIITELQRPDAH